MEDAVKTMISDLQIPKFRTSVPENLRSPLTETEQRVWLADQLSILDQKMDWTMKLLTVNHGMVQDHEARLQWWETKVKSPLVVAGISIAWFVPIAASAWSILTK